MLENTALDTYLNGSLNELLFAKIAQNLESHGYSINPGAFPAELAQSLWQHIQQLERSTFKTTAIGRGQQRHKNNSIRTDKAHWISPQSDAERQWLDWSASLQAYLNRYLLLGLFDFESQFTHYPPGAFYARHYDAFRGDTFHEKANRVLSLVLYLNPNWQAGDGGELVLYRDNDDQQGITVQPSWATLVTFLSEECPHEVLPTNSDRYAIAGWFRLRASI